MLALACQPIREEPDAGPPVNHPPRIVEGGETPKSALVEGVSASSSSPSATDCKNGLTFSVGTVEDDDLDQDVQERWVLQYDPNAAQPDLGELKTLQPISDQPAFRTDAPNGFTLSGSTIQGWSPSSAPHTVDVFISDGFDNAGSSGKPVKPTDVLPGKYLLRHTWVIYMESTCTTSP